MVQNADGKQLTDKQKTKFLEEEAERVNKEIYLCEVRITHYAEQAAKKGKEGDPRYTNAAAQIQAVMIEDQKYLEYLEGVLKKLSPIII